MSTNLWNWLSRSPKSREQKETLGLIAKVNSLNNTSPLATEEQANDFVFELIHDICERREVIPSIPLGEAIWDTIHGLLFLDGLRANAPDISKIGRLTLEEGVELRANLNRYIRFIEDHERLLPIWREKIAILFSEMLKYFPLSAFTDIDEPGDIVDQSVMLPVAKAYDLCDDLPEALDRLIITFFDKDITNARLFDDMRKRLEDNVLFASGIPDDKRHDVHPNKLVLPSTRTNRSNEYLVQTYLQATPFISFFESELPFSIPFPTRFEHTYIVGGTGHGKTQLMQFLIHHDLEQSLKDGRSVVVIDSQGDLFNTISHLKLFDPDNESTLADRLVLIDPHDIEHPVSLNMFDFNRDRLSGYAAVDREKILNATVELYEYFFGALLGAELTQRQGLIFKYLARLMLEIPDATIHTLRELMEDGERFRPHIERLSGSTRSFFETQFFERKFNETKKQILTRLWGVLSNASIERMFSHRENKIDIFEFLNDGKIILINTAKDLLGQEGTAIFGRFFIALIAQAAIQRSVLAPHKRRPSFVYIDEAQDYFDSNISHLLNQARKYKIGLVFAHQNLDQLGSGLRSSVLASTSVKFAGGLSAKDAVVMDGEMRCSSDLLLGQRKGRSHTEFACYVKNYTSRALSVRIPLGHIESLSRISNKAHKVLIDQNRWRYGGPPLIPSFTDTKQTPPPQLPAAPAVPPSEDRTRPASREVLEASIQTENIKGIPATVHKDIKAEPILNRPTEEGPSQGLHETAPLKPTKAPTRKKKEAAQGNHRYLQNLIKEMAEQRGFRATIEESILNGNGRVDVSLARGTTKIAFEISVTTSEGHELENIEKCIAAGYTDIVLVGRDDRHVGKLSKFITPHLAEEHGEKVQYLSPPDLVAYFEALPVGREEAEVIKGYKVKTFKREVDPEEATARRKAIAEVIAKSILKSNKGDNR